MTCIVGLWDQGHIYVGGDSSGSDCQCLMPRNDTKVFRRKEFVIGYTSSFRMGQLLRYRLDPAEKYTHQDVHEWMCTTVVDAIRQTFKTGGFAEIENEQESGGEFIIATHGRLFVVHSDYQVAEPAGGYWAVGSGGLVALGALHVLHDRAMPAQQKVLEALAAAQTHNPFVREPFEVEVWSPA